MTIRHGTHVTGMKPHHAAVQRQALRPLALATKQSARTEPASPDRSPIGPATASKTPAGSRQPLRATLPQPRNTTRPNLLSP
jgi:hypothetical protein